MEKISHKTISNVVLDKAELAPNKIAIIDNNGTRKTTWKDFATLIDQIARYASSFGLEGVVPVVQGRNMEYVATVLGLQLAGLGICPLTKDTPIKRIEYIKSDLGAEIIADEAFVENAKIVKSETHNYKESDIAWVIYTSGSTGYPKGVVYSNANLLSACTIASKLNNINENTITASSTSFSFCALIVDIYATLLSGGTVHILSDEYRKDSFLLEQYLIKHSVNYAYISPRMLANISAELPDMKLVITAGEKVSGLSPRSYQIKVLYGMTETFSVVTGFVLDKNYENTPIGKVVEGKNVYLLDEDGNLCDEGEICVSGVIADGYWNLPEQTAKVFTINPFSNDPRHRILLHTGDIARRLDDGNLVYLNRKDWMLKINGQRVEPGEIEHQIKAVKGVNEAVVKGFEGSRTYLCAWYTGDISENELKSQLADRINSYMMPAFIIKIDAFPINANGKLDRKALNAPDASSFLATYEAPINEVETAICEGFQKILGIEKIGRNDDFFSLGGDSISAIRLCSELKTYQVQSSQIFVGRSPKGIATIIYEQSQNNEQQCSEQSQSNERAYSPLTAGQLGVYYALINSPKSLEYNLPFEIKLDKKTDIDRLHKAIEEVLNTYPAFGVRFQVIDGQPCMAKRNPYIEIEYLETNEINEIKHHFIHPFDIEKGELARFLIVKTELAIHLLIDIHHIIFDGSSVKVLVNALDKAYKGEPLPKEDISIFQAANIEQTADSTSAYEFFKEKLTANDFESTLASDLSQDNQNETGSIFEYHFNEISNKIEYFARKNSISEASVFMGAFAWAFSKMIASPNICFCTAENGRNTSAYDNSIAMLVRTLPLAISIDEAIDSSTYLNSLSKYFYQTMANDSYPFYKLAEAFGVNNDTMFVYQAEMLDNLSFNDNLIQIEQLDTKYALSKLSVSVYKTKGSYKATISYRSNLYSINKIQTLCSLMQAALSGFIDGLALKDIPLVRDSAIQLLESFHGEDTSVIANVCEAISSDNDSVVDMLRRSMSLYPNNIAIVSGETKLTYKELDEISDRLAAYLVGQGIGREDVVAILADRNEMMAICPIAVIKAGAMYQPLDSSYPSDRLNFMVKDSGAKLLITPKHLRQLIDNKINTFYTEDIINLHNEVITLPTPNPEDAFVILYTSGSTGKPKGCILEHRNLISYFNHYIKDFNFNSQSKVPAYASFGFDASMMDLYPTLCVGGSVYIIPPDMRLDLEELNRYFEDNGITHVFFTTQVGRQFALTMRNKSLKYLMTGGESLVNISPNDDYNIIHMYGPTETTLVACSYPIDKFYKLPPIGRAFDNVNFYVLDPYMRRVPVGVSGELYIAGPQVARGYLNLPEKNAQSFIENPFSDNPKYKRMYRTGDIVSFLPDGNVQFVGRKDNQVKIRGFRIELSEIEEVIRRYEGIKNVAVLAFDSKESGKFIAAYIVSDDEVDIEKLNAFIRSEKPAYMVPAVTMQIDKIPLTQNHKVNKKALPTPVLKIENILQAQNEVQQRIFDLVAKILGYKEFGVNTDLEYAGLNSICSVKLLSALSKAFDRPLSLKELKENNTIEKLEKLLSESKEEVFELRDIYPLTKTQEGIFYECMNKPNSTFYNVPYLIELAESIDVEKLKLAIVQTINAHPYLMTTLSLTEEGVRCSRDNSRLFSVEDIEELNSDEDIVKPFNLQGGRLFRIALIKKSLLYIDVHHIIFDGRSLAIFIEDINRAYSGQSLEKEQFSGYETALNEEYLRSTPAFEKAKNYYNELFAEQSDASLPYGDYPDRSGYSSYNYTMQDISLIDIDNLCKSNKLTRNTVVTAAFGYLLAKYKNENCAVFTTVYDGRNDTRFARSISMYVKTYPVLCDISKDNISDYLNGLSKQIEASRLNDIYSFAEIHKDLGINAEVMFVYQDDLLECDTFCGEQFIGREVQIDTEKAPFTINIWIKDSKFYISAEYDASKYSEEYIEAFMHSYELSLKGIISKQELKDIELVDNQVLSVLESFHGEDIEHEKCSVTDMVRSTMKLYPDNIAIVSGETKLTYREFDEITDRLATYIVTQGIGREDAVAILADRDEFMAICPIAVIKAGAMYVPLDSSYPSERLNYMIKDSGAKLLITPKHLCQLIDSEINTFYTEDIINLHNEVTTLPIVKPEDAFVILYTSGSTGNPKGCVLEHRNFVAYSKFYKDRFKYDETSVVALYASFGFDASMMDTFAPLSFGATLHIIPIDMRLDLPLLNKYLEDNKVTHTFMTTQIGRTFVTTQQNHSLKYLILAGEALTPFIPDQNYTVVNGYGPSETCCGVSFFDIDRLYKSVPLGKANTNTKAYIVDKQFHRLPIGVPGELCIAGPQVSRGYINLPEKTAESFVDNPFSDDPEYNKIYRTGDIICFLPDGNLQFFGRKDTQVKIRGFRIELTEVEEVISRFESIKDNIVVDFDNPEGGKFLAAYIVSDEKINIEHLNAFIRAEKPAYMVPAVTMQIDKIPLTPNQKVNKKALPTPVVNTSQKYVAPQNKIEEDFCAIMGETLNIKKFSAADSFFELGGSSISATKVLLAAMAKGYTIAYPDLFRHQTPRDIANFINSINIANNNKDISEYDYSEINKFLAKTNIKRVDDAISRDFSIVNGKMGNVLLTGATGFLGIHILYVYLKGYTGNITCLVRKKSDVTNENWLKVLLAFYFSDDCAAAFEQGRINFIEASIADDDLAEKLEVFDFDTVIHCAASVAHFSSDDTLYRNNTLGTLNILQICEQKHKRFVHISTASVSGYEQDIQTKDSFDENDLYISQYIDNEYIRTKFLAERYVLEAALRGANVKILRLGNLMSRDYDGEFQINFSTNGFMRNLRGVTALGYTSIDLLDNKVNISPIDCTAEAVLTVADSDLPAYIYHIYNGELTTAAELIESLQEIGYPIQIVSDAEYRQQIALAIQKYKDDAAMSDKITGLIAYKDAKTGNELDSVNTNNDFTTQVLSRLGFIWPKIDKAYIKKMIKLLIGMGYFNKP